MLSIVSKLTQQESCSGDLSCSCGICSLLNPTTYNPVSEPHGFSRLELWPHLKMKELGVQRAKGFASKGELKDVPFRSLCTAWKSCLNLLLL